MKDKLCVGESHLKWPIYIVSVIFLFAFFCGQTKAEWPIEGWDFDIYNVSLSESAVSPNETLYVTVTIENTGTKLGTVHVYLGIQNPSGTRTYLSPRIIYDIPVGSRGTTTFTWSVLNNAEGGTYKATVDVYNSPETHMFDTSGFIYSFEVMSPGRLTVTVRKSTGDLMPGSEINGLVLYQDSSSNDIQNVDPSSSSYTFEDLSPGHSYLVEVYVTDMYVGDTGWVYMGSGDSESKTIYCPAYGTLNFQVFYDDGTTPLEDAYVEIWGGTQAWRSDFTDAQGKTILFYLMPTTLASNQSYYAIVYDGQQVGSAHDIQLSPGVNKPTIKIITDVTPPGGDLTVTVRKSTGDLMPGSEINGLVLYQDSSSNDIQNVDPSSSSYTFEDLSPGHSYLVEVYVTDMYVGDTGWVYMGSGDSESKTIYCPAYGTLNFQVFYDDGTTPLEDAYVEIWGGTQAWRSDFTDAQGKTILFYLMPTTLASNQSYYAIVVYNGQQVGSAVNIQLSPGENKPTIRITVDVNPLPSPPAFQSKAIYVWGFAANLLTEPSEQDRFFELAEEGGIKVVFLSIINYEWLTGQEANLYSGFISQASSRNIQVHAMFSDNSWAGSKEHARLYIEAILQYNANHIENKFQGIHLDIEPGKMPNEHYDDLNSFLLGYADLLDGLKTRYEYNDETVVSQGMAISIDVAWWWVDSTTESKNLLKNLLEVADLDYFCTMGYHKTTEVMKERVNKILECNSTNKFFVIAIETQESHRNDDGVFEPNLEITFFEEGQEAFYQALNALQDYYSENPNFRGFAIHFYQSAFTSWNLIVNVDWPEGMYGEGDLIPVTVTIRTSDNFDERDVLIGYSVRDENGNFYPGNGDDQDTSQVVRMGGKEQRQITLYWKVPSMLIVGPGTYDVTVAVWDIDLNYGELRTPYASRLNWVEMDREWKYDAFSIIESQNNPPSITLLSPNGGETLPAGGQFNIFWDASDAEDGENLSISIYYSVDGGISFPNIIAFATQNDGHYLWNVPDTSCSTCRILIVAYDSGGLSNEDMSDGDFTISSSPTPPDAPSGFYAGPVYTETSVQLNWIDNSDDETEFRIYVDGGYYESVQADTTSRIVTGLTCGTTYDFYVTAYNANGESSPSNTVSASTLSCAAQPQLLVDPTYKNFGTMDEGQTASWTFHIENTGGGTLLWNATENIPWVSISPTAGITTTETDSVTVNIDTTGLAPGLYNGYISVNSNDGYDQVYLEVTIADGSAVIIFEDDFEAYTVNTFPSSGGWVLQFDGMGAEYQKVVDIYSVSGSKSLQLWGSSGTAAAAIKSFSHNSAIIGYEVWVRIDVLTGSNCIAYVGFYNKDIGPSGTPLATVNFYGNGTIGVEDGSIIQTYEPNTWYKVKAIVDINAQSYSVWIDDVLKAQDIPEPDVGIIQSLLLDSAHAGEKAYFDDVRVFIPSQAQPPEAPSGLYAGPVYTETSVQLNWIDNSDDETEFRIYVDGGYYESVQANTTSYIVTGLTCGTTYDFYVTAYNSYGESSPSNTVTASTTPCTPPGRIVWKNEMRVTHLDHKSTHPDIAIDSNGVIHIVWSDETPNGAGYDIFYKRYNGTSWSDNIRITPETDPDPTAQYPRLAIDSSNNIHVVWVDSKSGFYEIYYAKLDNMGNILVSPKLLTADDEQKEYWVDLAVDSQDRLHLVWQHKNESINNYEIHYMALNNSGVITINDRILYSDNNTDAEMPKIALDSGDCPHIVYTRSTYQYSADEVFYTKLDSDGNILIQEREISLHDGYDSYYPNVIIDSAGRVHVVWRDTRDGMKIYYSQLDNYGNTLIDDVPLGIAKDAGWPTITEGPSTTICVAWQGESIHFIRFDGISWTSERKVTSNSAVVTWWPEIAWNGDELSLVWSDSRDGNQEVYFMNGVEVKGTVFGNLPNLFPADNFHIVGDQAKCTDVLGTANISWSYGSMDIARPEGKTDMIITAEEHTTCNLMLMGGPEVNTITVEFNDHFGITYESLINVSLTIFCEGQEIFLDVTKYPSEDICIVYLGQQNNRNVLTIWGYGWQGTYAGSLFMSNLEVWDAYPNEHLLLLRWTDENGNNFIEFSEIHPENVVEVPVNIAPQSTPQLVNPVFSNIPALFAGNAFHVVGDQAKCTDVLGTANISWSYGSMDIARPEGKTDMIITAEEHTTCNLMLMGGPEVNTITVEFNDHFGITYESLINVSLTIFCEGQEIFLDVTKYPSEDICIVYLGQQNNRNVLTIWGYGWQGTYAGSLFMSNPSNWLLYGDSHLLMLRWKDENGDGFVQMPEITEETNQCPIVTLLSPNGGEALTPGGQFDITWEASDDEDGANLFVDLSYSTDGGASYPYIICTFEQNDGHFSWNVPDISCSTCRILVQVTDTGGLQGEDMSDGDFTISEFSTSIKIVGTWPMGGVVDEAQSGLAWDGSYLWSIVNGQKMHMHDPNDVSSILYKSWVPGTGEGIAWDGANMWVTHTTSIFKLNGIDGYDYNEIILSECTTPIAGLTWRDGYIWAVNHNDLDAEIRKIDPNDGTVLERYTFKIESSTHDTDESNASSIEWDPYRGVFWLGLHRSNIIYMLDGNDPRDILQTYIVEGITGADGLALGYNGEVLWASSVDGAYLYKLTIVTNSPQNFIIRENNLFGNGRKSHDYWFFFFYSLFFPLLIVLVFKTRIFLYDFMK